MKIALSFLVLSLAMHNVFSQQEMKYVKTGNPLPHWVELMYSESPDPGEVVAAYETHFRLHEFNKNQHTPFYKRWLRQLSRDVNGRNASDANKIAIDQNEALYLLNSANSRHQRGGNGWTPIGPFDFDRLAASSSYAAGAAHVYTVEQSLSNPSLLYAGTATSGVWKSTDKGENWQLTTGEMMINGVVSLEIHPTHPDTAWFAAAGDVFRTLDGATSWQEIGDATFRSLEHSVKDISINPNSTQSVFLCSSEGLFRSTDHGDNWVQLQTGSFLEIEFHPLNNNFIYAVKQTGDKTEFYQSQDGGASWQLQTSGWPNPGAGDEQKRTEIAVTPAAPNMVVALATGSANGGSGLYGLYISHDRGDTWSFECCGPQPAGVPDSLNPNLMGWSDEGLDDGGQYYYDLALAVSPIDSNLIHVGGVNHWLSNDGGQTFTCPAKWSHSSKPNYVHADIHDIRYFGNDLWIACDGGVFYSADAGANISRKMFGISGTDFWGFGTGYSDGEVMLGGTYHNATLLKDHQVYENGWLSTHGGDNYRGFVNPADARKVYHDGGGRILSGDRTVGLGSFPFGIRPNASYIIGENSNLEWDPRCHSHIYVGNDTTLYKTEDNGLTYSVIHQFPGKVTGIEVSRANPNFIYVAVYPGWWDDKKLFKSTDGGISWIDITPDNSVFSSNLWAPFDISVSGTDENKIWLARCPQSSNYNNLDGFKIFTSDNGGQTWTNLTTPTLDGEYITNIEHQIGTNDGVYLGTRRAVYYRNATMTDWSLFNTGLPVSTTSTQLIPYYWEGKIRNGTNRSVWEIELYENTPPVAQIAADRFIVNCLDDTVRFFDQSVLNQNGASWQWTFAGGIPASSTARNPVVVYPSTGAYSVSLQVSDTFGNSVQTLHALIIHEPLTTPAPYSTDFEQPEFAPNLWTIQNPDQSYSWEHFSANADAACDTGFVAFINHHDYNNPGSEDYLVSPKFDMNNILSAELKYDYAYARWGAGYEDSFRVDLSTDCGNSWIEIYYRYGEDLATTTDQNAWWQPVCGEWDSVTLDLLPFAENEITIRFVGINGWGNNFYLDNVNINVIYDTTVISSANEQNPMEGIYLFPNPFSGSTAVLFNNPGNQMFMMTLRNMAGQSLRKAQISSSSFQLKQEQLNSGIYLLELKNEYRVMRKKVVVR